MKGKLYILSGPSGAGKGTVCKELLKSFPEMVLSISMTTRKPRKDEIEGVSYFFVDREKFDKIKAQNGFLETAQHFDSCYGTPKQFVVDNLEKGKNVLLEIEPVGALQVKSKMNESVLMFLTVPSFDDLIARLKKRGSETDETIKKRMEKAEIEMTEIEKYDYVVVNDSVDNAVEKIVQIIGRKHI